MIVKRCATCGRFRPYEDGDAYCVVCGNESLEAECGCGRAFEYAVEERGDVLHCPRCGKRVRGRGAEVG